MSLRSCGLLLPARTMNSAVGWAKRSEPTISVALCARSRWARCVPRLSPPYKRQCLLVRTVARIERSEIRGVHPPPLMRATGSRASVSLLREADMRRRNTPSPHLGRPRRFNQRRANVHAKAALAEIFKFDVLFAPDYFESARGRPLRLHFALLQLVDCPRRQPNARPEFAPAPAEHGARQPNLGGKSMSREPAKLAQIAGVCRKMNCHGQ